MSSIQKPVLRAGSLEEAERILQQISCDRIILAGFPNPFLRELIDARGQHPQLLFGTDTIEDRLGRVPLSLIVHDGWLTELGTVRPLGRGYAFAKRTLDIAVAVTVGLAFLLILPLLALAIRLDSPGPAVLRQTRVGLGGKPFRIYKFRTMYVGADRSGPLWAQRADPRVTRVGRFMRQTRLDELPQIWNLLIGEMTLVGPRPLRPQISAGFEGQRPVYAKRHAVKPGLTGWAQVCHGYADSEETQWKKLEFDLYYVKRASFWLDLRILFRTFLVVARMQGR
jgi:lipopolysaccharide/colanic/teichoic acid biosynthesis glycosyltransferase